MLLYGDGCVGVWAAVPAALHGVLSLLICCRDLLSTVATEIGAATVATIANFDCWRCCLHRCISVKLVLLATPGVVSLCAVGGSSVSAIVILSSSLCFSSLLLLSSVRPLFK